MIPRIWLLNLLVFTTIGCAPAISQEVLRDVDEGVSFQEIQRHPGDFVGRTVLFGGKIIETNPLPGKTRITVLQHPLNYRNKPSTDEASAGRFIVETEGFLDPVIYSAGRLVTVAGTLSGQETRPLGEIEYAYPVIASRELHLWPLDEPGFFPGFHFGIGVGAVF